MTNNQHGQVPEALRLANLCSNLTRYSMDAHLIAAELRRQHARIAEIEAVGAGGVQALSAAPAEQEEAAQRLRKTLDIDPGDVNDPLHPRYIAGFKSGHAAGRRRAAPAASPTPPAEQQVIIDFAQVGTAGPFHVVNGRVKLPDATMQDLARMLRPTYEAEQAVHASVKGAMWFTKKPVTIQAIQWTGDNLREVITFTDGPPDTRSHHAGMAWDAYRDLVARDGLKIYTLEGKMLASPGDWIIRGVKGEMYPCKDESFQETYAAASPTPPAEQQAQPGAVYAELGCDEVSRVVDVVVERCISLTQDATGIKVVYDPIILGDALLTELRDFADRTHALRMQAAPKAAPGDPYQDSTPHLSVGDSSFESWFGSYCPANKGDKQRARDAYAAGMGDPLVRAAPQQEAQEPCPTCVALARTVMLDQVSFDRKPDCYGIRQITDDEGVEEWEDIRTSPDVAREEANDMMATGRGEIYEVVPLYTAPLPAPAPLSEMPYEKRKAIQEGEQIGASDAWFHARHNMLDTLDRRNVFRAGFDRGWNAALAAQGGKDA